ncbi:MAG TPA: ABC transporter substrate-binding protein [Bacteroidia bacterium]|jgi:peptide/nickel transport system substrate-binding protein
MKRTLLFAATAILLQTCGSGSGDKSSENKRVFRYNETGGINSLDPAAANKSENIWAVNQVFNGLVQLDDQLKVIPSIAKSWELYDDGREYTFHLRNDVYFQDDACFPDGRGRKVTADDFVQSFYRLMELKSERSSMPIFKLLERSERTNFIGFTAPNDSTFKIFLDKPFPPFLEILSMHYFSVVPHEAADKYGEDFGRHPVGTGPFKFKVWDEGQKLVLVRNENYFEKEGGQRLPYLEAVDISFIKDNEIAFTEFLKGNFDMISGTETINKKMVLDPSGGLTGTYKGKFVLQTGPYLKTDYLGILVDPRMEIVKESPLHLKEVRQAINYAIDREKIINYLRYGIGTPALSGFIPEGLPSFDKNKVKGYHYDPDKSRELLRKAGYGDKDKMPEIELNVAAQYADMSNFIKKELEDVGFRIKININQNSVQSTLVGSSRVNFFRKSWVGDYADAQDFFSIFYSKNFSPEGSNYFHFANDEFDKLYEQACAEPSDSVRYGLYQRMDNILMEESPVVPLFYDEFLRLVQNDVEGLTTNPMNLLNLKRVKKKAE